MIDITLKDTQCIEVNMLSLNYNMDFDDMLAAVIDEAYDNMWKDVEKERYDDYKD